jgi:hypothetical protein
MAEYVLSAVLLAMWPMDMTRMRPITSLDLHRFPNQTKL